MANQYSFQVLDDGYRNARVKIDGNLDSSDAILVPAIGISAFVGNDPNLIFAGFRVDAVQFSISPNLVLSLFWEALVPQAIVRVAGYSNLEFEGGIFPDRTKSGYSGNILLSTQGWDASKPQVFTVDLNMVKLYSV